MSNRIGLNICPIKMRNMHAENGWLFNALLVSWISWALDRSILIKTRETYAYFNVDLIRKTEVLKTKKKSKSSQ